MARGLRNPTVLMSRLMIPNRLAACKEGAENQVPSRAAAQDPKAVKEVVARVQVHIQWTARRSYSVWAWDSP